jgi:hypothetical protein
MFISVCLTLAVTSSNSFCLEIKEHDRNEISGHTDV